MFPEPGDVASYPGPSHPAWGVRGLGTTRLQATGAWVRGYRGYEATGYRGLGTRLLLMMASTHQGSEELKVVNWLPV